MGQLFFAQEELRTEIRAMLIGQKLGCLQLKFRTE
jgi:hypothetical protein